MMLHKFSSAEDALRLRAAALYKAGMAALAMGDFSRGWALYDERLKMFPDSYRDILSPPPSSPEAFNGKHVLIIGDPDYTPLIGGQLRPDLRAMSGGYEIMFAQYLPNIFEQQPKSLTVLTDARLCSLFERSWPETRFIPRANAVEDIADQIRNLHMAPDMVAPLGSLGRVYIKSRKDVPAASSPWLKPDPERTRHFRTMLHECANGRIPVAISHWSAGIDGKSVDDITHFFSAFSSLADTCMFINFQYARPEYPADEARDLFMNAFQDRGIADPPTDLWQDIDGATALLAAIRDENGLAVMVPNYTESLACGIGIPTLKLLHGSFTSDYGFGRVWNEDVFVYPWTSTYLQDHPGAWKSVFAQVTAELTCHAAGHPITAHRHDRWRFICPEHRPRIAIPS